MADTFYRSAVWLYAGYINLSRSAVTEYAGTGGVFLGRQYGHDDGDNRFSERAEKNGLGLIQV